MLMTQSGQMIGVISGGCLENDVYEYTQQRMHSSDVIVVTYDTTADEDLIWGFGIGCNGTVQVLIERLNSKHSVDQIAFLENCLRIRQKGIMATVFYTEGPVPIGSRLMLSAYGQITTDIQELALTSSITRDAHIALHNQQSVVKQYQWSTGCAEVLIEVIEPAPSLVVFGAGQDALPVVQLAKTLGWEVTVVDCRASEATKERFAIADHIILTRRDALVSQVSIHENIVVVVMTHNYFDDLAVLNLSLATSARYVGLLGTRSRTQRLLQDLRLETTIAPDQLNRLHAPVGLDIGANTPQEIALAIVTEIQIVLAGRSGQSLKDRKTPIHQQFETDSISTVCIDGVLMDV